MPDDTPERVRDSKVCCKHLLGEGLLLWFHFVGGGGFFQDIHVGSSMPLGDDIFSRIDLLA